jgi:uncharacterized coiled-coil DUF342 family protein
MQSDFARIEAGLSDTLARIDSSLEQLTAAPALFRASVEEIAGLINSVISAVQGQDITRQQLEHVHQALLTLAGFCPDEEKAPDANADAMLAAGLSVQKQQLDNICRTVEDWIGRVRSSVQTIHQISSAEVISIVPLVLEQERQLTAELARIEAFEQESEAGSEEIQSALQGLEELMRLVSAHLERSHQVRDRLQLLTFNSIVEANRLGSKADAILEISQSIKRISAAWTLMTEESAQVQQEIQKLIDQSSDSTGQPCGDSLRLAREQTRESLLTLHAAAEKASHYTQGLETATAGLQATAKQASEAGDRLERTLKPLPALLIEIEHQDRRLGIKPESVSLSDKRRLEEIFEPAYTTEIERSLLRSALYGEPMPDPGSAANCNDVELF